MADVGTDVSHPPTGTYTQPERHSAFEQTNQVTTDAGTDVSRPDTGIYTQPERHSAFEQTNQVTTDVGTDVSRPDTETYTQPERHSAFEQTNQVTTDVGTDVSRPPTYTQPGRDKSVPTAPNSLTRRNSLARRTGIATAGVSKPPGVVQQRTSMRMEHVPSTTLEVESIPSEHAQTRGASQQEHTALVPPGNQRITPHVTSEGERILPEQNSVVSRNEQRAMPTPELSVSAPTIQVTIGRIEVRAMTPPAPPARPKPSRPDTGLSLDDYLDQYNGRKR